MIDIVVVGDTLLDADVIGEATRLCPDAPAPVVDEERVVERPGGAGLAAVLLARRGISVGLVTALAPDDAGRRLADLLTAEGITIHDCGGVAATVEKVRIRVDGRSLLRLDRGGGGAPGPLPEPACADLDGAAAILVADYGRGLAARDDVRAALRDALARGTSVVWDPHPRGPVPVEGCTLVTPNAGEATIAVGDRLVTGDDEQASSPLGRDAARALQVRSAWGSRHVALTCGRRGAVLVGGDGAPLVVPVDVPVDGGDPCGAGDAFAASATAALAEGALPSEAVIAAVEASSRFVAAGGAAGVGDTTRPEETNLEPSDAASSPFSTSSVDAVVAAVRQRGGTVVATGGCFDILHPGHVATLERARRIGDCLVVLLNSDASVRGLKGPDRPAQSEEDRAAVLRSLSCVDGVVVFDEDTPVAALERLRPDVFVKGGDYTAGELPETAALRQWGGTVVTVPFVSGRSTTEILARSTAPSPTTPEDVNAP